MSKHIQIDCYIKQYATRSLGYVSKQGQENCLNKLIEAGIIKEVPNSNDSIYIKSYLIFRREDIIQVEKQLQHAHVHYRKEVVEIN